MKEYKRDYITTYSKLHFTPLEPDPEDLRIEDVAHALSLITRAGGHFATFHSVACHCLECAAEAKARGLSLRVQLACLLHDASEAYLADVTRPVKKHMDYYREVENRLLSVIYDKYLGGLNDEEAALVKEMDDTLLYYEFYHFMGEELSSKPELFCKPDFSVRPFDEVENEYLKTFYELFGAVLIEGDKVEVFEFDGQVEAVENGAKDEASAEIASGHSTEIASGHSTEIASKTSAEASVSNSATPGFASLKGIKAVLFDMDGVIVDTEKLYLRFWREAAIHHGFPMTEEQALSFRSTNRIKAQKMFHDYFGPTADYTTIRNTRIELMNAYLQDHPAEPKPGIYELTDWLKKRGIKIVICTMSDPTRVDLMLKHNDLLERFDDVITQSMVKLGKPAPDIYLAACEKLGLAPSECLVVEDSPSGCTAGHAAGCPVLMVPDADFPSDETKKEIQLRANRLDYLIPLLARAEAE